MKYVISVLCCLICGVLLFFQFGPKDASEGTTESTVESQTSDSAAAISYEELYLNIDELFMNNKAVFTQTADILSKTEKDMIVIFDEDESSISQVNIDNVFYEAEEIFDATEIIVISECYGYMRDYAPESISISFYKFTDINGIEKMEFCFRGDFGVDGYIDIGVLYSDYDFTGQYEKLGDNWYKFRNGLA